MRCSLQETAEYSCRFLSTGMTERMYGIAHAQYSHGNALREGEVRGCVQGVAARQHDAFSIGMTTTDDFQNADVLYAETLPALRAALAQPPGAPKAIPVVTGFLGRGINTGLQICLANVSRARCCGNAGSSTALVLYMDGHAPSEEGTPRPF